MIYIQYILLVTTVIFTIGCTEPHSDKDPDCEETGCRDPIIDSDTSIIEETGIEETFRPDSDTSPISDTAPAEIDTALGDSGPDTDTDL